MEEEFIRGTIEYLQNPIVLLIIIVGVLYQVCSAIKSWWQRKHFFKDWMKKHNIGKKYR